MCLFIGQGIRSMTRFCSKIGWKWKWSGKCRKSEISLIWCISTTNNVKSCKKFNETAQTANFTDLSLTSCEYRPKWTKTMQTQTRRVALQIFLRGIQLCHMKADVLAIPKMWWFFILEFLNPSYCCPKSGQISSFFFAKLRCQKKYMWLQYCDSGQIVESAWSHTYWLHADSTIWPESQYCSRIYFFEHRNFAKKKIEIWPDLGQL